ncbi:hypothetical protein [Schumannella soli]|uniref:hypothetical protein n=1 Tax=Schumannella soli TaxID=2590779 RepID=UPI0015E869E3|nr:hypothetical protein [Schumannella soli]
MTTAPLFRRIIRYGAVLALVVAVLGGVVGVLVAGVPGLLGGLIGALAAVLFLVLTSASILAAGRATGGDITNPVFFAIVLGGWIVKFVLFIVLLIWLKSQDWIAFPVLYGALLASIIGSLVIDVIAVRRSRIPYVEVALPGDDAAATDGVDAAPGDTSDDSDDRRQ